MFEILSLSAFEQNIVHRKTVQTLCYMVQFLNKHGDDSNIHYVYIFISAVMSFSNVIYSLAWTSISKICVSGREFSQLITTNIKDRIG